MTESRSLKRFGIVVWMVAAVIGALVPGSRAGADHIGVLQLSGDPAGPYTVSVWTQPAAVRAGTSVAVTVAVMRPETRLAVTDVAVQVVAQQSEAPVASVSAEATRDRDPMGLQYLADLTLPAAGRWTVAVAIRGPAGAGGATFPLHVEATSWTSWLWFGVGAGAISLFTAWRLYHEWRRGRPHRGARRRTTS